MSQLLYGDFFKIIDERKDWYKIRLQWDNYEGWITQHQAQLIQQEDYTRIQKRILSWQYSPIDFVQLPSQEIFPIPLGSDLRGLSLLGHSCEEQPKPLMADKAAL